MVDKARHLLNSNTKTLLGIIISLCTIIGIIGIAVNKWDALAHSVNNNSSHIDAQKKAFEIHCTDTDKYKKETRAEMRAQTTKVTVIATKQDIVIDTIDKMDDKLDKLIENGH